MKKKPPQPITLEEWLADMQATGAHGGDGGASCRDLCEATGINEKRMRVMLTTLSRQGKLKVGRANYTRLDGVRATIPVYSLKAA